MIALALLVLVFLAVKHRRARPLPVRRGYRLPTRSATLNAGDVVRVMKGRRR